MKTKAVADYFGNKSRVAEALGISAAAVTMWGEDVPESRQYQIQVLTKGKIKADPKPSAA